MYTVTVHALNYIVIVILGRITTPYFKIISVFNQCFLFLDVYE